MKRDHAERIIQITKRMDEALNDLHLITEEMSDPAEKKQLKRALFDVVLDVYEKITVVAAAQYPDLHPDKEHIEQLRNSKS